MVVYYGFSHKSIKWWKRVFFHMLDLALVNAHLLYLASGNKLTQLGFRQDVAKSLLEGFERQGAHRTPREHQTFLSGSQSHGHFWSQQILVHVQTVESAAIDQQGNDTRQAIAAKAAKHPCAHTLVWNATTT